MEEYIVEDPLKNIDEICTPDEIQKYFVGSLEDCHRILSRIELLDIVPGEVRQLFETAKNVSLYSYFAQRFHQASEIVGYSALELAFKFLCGKELQKDMLPNGLSKLMFYAKKRNWLDNDYFENIHESTRIGIRMLREKQAEKEKRTPGIEASDPDREITAGELKDGVHKSVAVDGVILLTAKLRNNLAHGSKTLHPNSISTLRKIAEIINYVYTSHEKEELTEI